MNLSKMVVAAAALCLCGCAADPARYGATLDQHDPKWDSRDCKDIRLAALNFDQKIGQRVAIGLASGLLLGPFGIPIAVAADANQDERRKAFDREVHLRCSSKPLPENLQVKKPTSNSAGSQHSQQS